MSEKPLPETGYFRLADYFVDVGDNRIFHDQQGRHIEPKAMHVLYQLALNAEETVSRQLLMERVWQGRIVIEDALTRTISQLRWTFDDNKSRQLIQTVPKKGYRLTANVTWLTRQEFIELSNMKSPPPVDKSASQTHPETKTLSIFALIALLVAVGWWLLTGSTWQNKDIGGDTRDIPANTIEVEDSDDLVTIALLPWRNLTGDDGNDYLAEMIPEELSVQLGKSEGITVMAHYSAFALANKTRALDDLVNQLEVPYWVEGSVTDADKRIRMVVRLIEKSTNTAVWSEVYTGDIDQLLTLQDNIIVDLKKQLLANDVGENAYDAGSDIGKKVDINAYQAYLQGNYWWMNGTTSEWFYRAEALFNEATALDPDFAAAFGSLAFIYARYNYHDVYMSSNEAISKAKAAIKSALTNDPNDINALLASALIAIDAMEFEKAQTVLNQVLTSQPKNTRALYVYSELALAQNQFDKALIYAEQALSHDPLSPWINVNKAMVHYWRNEPKQALSSVQRSINIDSNYTWAYVWKAKILAHSGRLEEAVDAMKKCLQIDEGSPVNNIYAAMLYQQTGQKLLAQQWLEHTASLYGDSPDARFWQSYIDIAKLRGDKETVLQLLNNVRLDTTKFFSLVPLKLALVDGLPAHQKALLNTFVQQLYVGNSEQFYVNHNNHFNAYGARILLRQLIAQTQTENQQYNEVLRRLNQQIQEFERHVAKSLSAEQIINDYVDALVNP